MNMDYKYTIRELREPYPVPCTLGGLMEEFKYNSEMDFECTQLTCTRIAMRVLGTGGVPLEKIRPRSEKN